MFRSSARRLLLSFAIFLAALLAGCSGKASNNDVSLGTLKIAIDVLKSDAGGRPIPFPPELTVAYCSIPVWVPDGPRKVMTSNYGMTVEIGWDEVRPLQKSNLGVTSVAFRNFRWSMSNPLRCGVKATSFVIPTTQNLLTLTQRPLALKPPQSMASNPSNDSPWQKNLHWVVDASWTAGFQGNTQEIDVVKRYQMAHPELVRPTPTAAGARRILPRRR